MKIIDIRRSEVITTIDRALVYNLRRATNAPRN